MVQFVRKHVHTKVYDPISGDSDHEGADALLGYSNRPGQQPRRCAYPDTGRSRIQQTESREIEVGCKRHSIDHRDSDRGVTSFVVCVRDEAVCHLAIVEALLRELTAGVPWLLGKCGKETSALDGEQGNLMVGWSAVGA